MSGSPRLSIIISPSGLEQHIPRLLHSLSRQGPQLMGAEILLSQFASGQDFSETKRQWQGLLPETEIIAVDDKAETITQALNNTLNKARGEFILHLSPRVRLIPGCISRFMSVFDGSPEISVVYSDYVRTGSGPFLPGESGLATLPDFNPTLLRARNIVGPAAAMRREVWKDCGEFKSNTMYRDWDYWIRAALRDHRFEHVSRPLYAHDGSGQMTFRTRAADGGAKAMVVINNHAFFSGTQVRWALSHLRGEKWATGHRLAEIPDSKAIQAMTSEYVALSRGISRSISHNTLHRSGGPSLAQALLGILL